MIYKAEELMKLNKERQDNAKIIRMKVLGMILAGYTKKEIEQKLRCSQSTINRSFQSLSREDLESMYHMHRNLFPGVCTEDTAVVFKYVKVQKFTVTVLDTYYDVDNTTLLSSEVRVSELIRAGSSYSYEALGTIGFKVTGQDSYTGIVSEDITLTFRYIEDIDVLGGTVDLHRLLQSKSV